MTWQPIETAPRDGTEILIWEKEFEAFSVGCFLGDEPFWYGFTYKDRVNPTHWMPLPEPPEEE